MDVVKSCGYDVNLVTPGQHGKINTSQIFGQINEAMHQKFKTTRTKYRLVDGAISNVTEPSMVHCSKVQFFLIYSQFISHYDFDKHLGRFRGIRVLRNTISMLYELYMTPLTGFRYL
jgi:hypothetical protein